MTKPIFYKTKEESREEMTKAAEFTLGNKILVCHTDGFYYRDDLEELFPNDQLIAGAVVEVKGTTNHRGTWTGTWKYKTDMGFVSFGLASQPGKCSTCQHRLSQVCGPGCCPGIYKPLEDIG